MAEENERMAEHVLSFSFFINRGVDFIIYTVIVLNAAGAEIRRYEGVTRTKYIGDGVLLLTFQSNIDMEVYVNINTSVEIIATSLIKEAEENAKKKKSETD